MTASHKCPRTLDVDVVGAGDINDDLQCFRELVQPAVDDDADIEPGDPPPVEATELPALQYAAIRTDVCNTCEAEDPPPHKRRQPK